VTAEVVRIVAYFPLGSTVRAETRGWADASAETLSAYGPWREPGVRDDLGLQDYGSAILDRFLRNMPRGVVELRGVEDVVGATMSAGSEFRRLVMLDGDDGWQLIDARLSLWNVGTGLVCLTFEIPRRAYRREETLIEDTRATVHRMAPAVTHLVRTHLGAPPTVEVDDVIALWANAVYLIAPTSDASEQDWDALAVKVSPFSRRVGLDAPQSPAVRIGRNSCVVAEDLDDPLVTTLIRLAGAHQVCWATALAHDAALEAQLTRIQPNDPTLRIEDLERQTDEILGLYHAVQSFRLRYSSVEPHLDPVDQVVWRGIEEEWQFGRLLDSLDGRLSFLQTLHQQLSASLQSRRSRLLNGLVVAFTFLSILGILVAAMTFLALRPFRVELVTSGALSLSLAVTITAYYLYMKYMSRR
jgi:hypothetical protein